MNQGIMRTVLGIAFSGLMICGAEAKPVKTTGSFTLYYVAEVDPSKAGRGGIKGKVKTTEGKWETYRLSPSHTKSANMEGTVAVTEPDGSTTIVSIAKVGEWTDLPKGWHGKGNRMNTLTPYRTVAADQKYHPYGSRIFISDVEGFKTPEGKILDGYFWVADTGGGIKSRNRFDVFVGSSQAYFAIMKEPSGAGKWKAPTLVENLPTVSGKFNPKTDSGVKQILEGLGSRTATPIEGKNVSNREKEGSSLAEMLTDFQRRHPAIPKPEYGSSRGAITLWYLTEAALALKTGKDYPAKPSE